MADVLITSGGVSMGTRDLIKPLLDRMATFSSGGSRSTRQAADLRHDGRRQLCFGLPGFPVSSLVTFEVFVRPALLKMARRRTMDAAPSRGVLGHDIRPDPIRRSTSAPR